MGATSSRWSRAQADIAHAEACRAECPAYKPTPARTQFQFCVFYDSLTEECATHFMMGLSFYLVSQGGPDSALDFTFATDGLVESGSDIEADVGEVKREFGTDIDLAARADEVLTLAKRASAKVARCLLHSIDDLGFVLAFSLCNKPPNVKVELVCDQQAETETCIGKGASLVPGLHDEDQLGTTPTRTDESSSCIAHHSLPHSLSSNERRCRVTFALPMTGMCDNPVQGHPNPPVEPQKTVRAFHIHAHFDDTCEDEAMRHFQGIMDYIETRAYERELVREEAVDWSARAEGHETVASPSVKHHRVFKGKNGPHDKWSWQVYVNSSFALAAGVEYLACSVPRPTPMEVERGVGLYTLFHCRTHDDTFDNEYNDHKYRLGWVGERDPYPLDLDFFAH